MLIDKFGKETINEIETFLEGKFDKEINNLRHYFTLLDAHISEVYHVDPHKSPDFQRLECFILAHNFVGPD
jgi:hypothetical protein